MSARDLALLASYESAGLKLSRRGDRLHVEGHKKTCPLTPQLRERLKAHKWRLLCAIQQRAKARAAATVLVAALLFVGCGTSPPRVIETPPVCPAVPDVPAEANIQLPEFLPAFKQPLPDAESASELLRVRVDSAAQYQSCRGAYEALRGWVIRHSR